MDGAGIRLRDLLPGDHFPTPKEYKLARVKFRIRSMKKRFPNGRFSISYFDETSWSWALHGYGCYVLNWGYATAMVFRGTPSMRMKYPAKARIYRSGIIKLRGWISTVGGRKCHHYDSLEKLKKKAKEVGCPDSLLVVFEEEYHAARKEAELYSEHIPEQEV